MSMYAKGRRSLGLKDKQWESPNNSQNPAPQDLHKSDPLQNKEFQNSKDGDSIGSSQLLDNW